MWRFFRRRRALVWSLGGVVMALVLVAGAFVLWPAADRPAKFVGAPQDRLGPVVLVPGFGADVGVLEQLADVLKANGRDAYIFDPPNHGEGDLRVSARALAAFVKGLHVRSVDMVGHSAGGVLIRMWITSYGGQKLARRVVTAGTPHHGTRLAGVAKAIVSGTKCPLACQQLSPDSPIITDLNVSDETPEGPLWTSTWTRTDDVVVPSESARLTGAVNIPLQSICADVKSTHGRLPEDPLVIGIVRASIGIPAPRTPKPAECQSLRLLGTKPPADAAGPTGQPVSGKSR